eukprot:TRINITY_DN29325_c0_g1_i1.p1 TRINITY_DN29325_c0_g1~~TRINITY_DN29325_c0_g1_i1.p1  ORF type:complete len:214 (+),score=44.08 TRINITY_DN29325_c0_g1_i1:170-811(+)
MGASSLAYSLFMYIIVALLVVDEFANAPSLCQTYRFEEETAEGESTNCNGDIPTQANDPASGSGEGSRSEEEDDAQTGEPEEAGIEDRSVKADPGQTGDAKSASIGADPESAKKAAALAAAKKRRTERVNEIAELAYEINMLLSSDHMKKAMEAFIRNRENGMKREDEKIIYEQHVNRRIRQRCKTSTALDDFGGKLQSLKRHLESKAPRRRG